jgi:RNA polymerase sigma-70 factor (ECF subfamily)
LLPAKALPSTSAVAAHGSMRPPVRPTDGERAMNEDDFQHALLAARGGDERSFEVLWRTFNPRLVRVLYGLGGNQDAEDLASSVWVDVLRSLDQFRGTEDAFRGWLYTIARRRLIDLRRRDARRPQESLSGVDDRAGDALDPATYSEDQSATAEALALIGTLPSDQAEVVLLRVVAGLDVAQVAAIIGRKPGTVRVMAHRGLRRLAVELAKRADAPGSDRGVTP